MCVRIRDTLLRREAGCNAWESQLDTELRYHCIPSPSNPETLQQPSADIGDALRMCGQLPTNSRIVVSTRSISARRNVKTKSNAIE